jgi:hypothetical protein
MVKVQGREMLCTFHIPSVHCAGLSDVLGAYQYVVLELAVGFPDKLKAIHSVIT